MPNLKRRKGKRRGRRTYATKSQFMPPALAVKRYGQLSTKTFFFKTAGTINSDNSGQTTMNWPTQFQPAIVGNPKRMPVVADSVNAAEMYTEYKVVAVKVTVFAANIGSEPGQAPIPPITGFSAGYNRGATVMYIDQEVRPNEPLPLDLTEVLNYGSTRMIPSRADKHTRIIFRKKGVPEWGCCDRNVPIADRQPDRWDGAIFLLGNFARLNLGIRPLWFYTVAYKITFRGRSFTP